jgi:hypothetical protein
MKMLQYSWLATLLACFSLGAYADSFVVTKDGKGLWTVSVRKDEKALYYIDKTTGDEKPLSLSIVEGVVPSVQRGVQYKPEQIKSNLANIKALAARHMSLTRELTQLQNEWQALQKGDPGFAKQIDAITDKFKAGDRGIKAYKGATMDLGMLKYKDVQGTYTAKIDAAVAAVKDEFVAVGLAHLDVMSKTNRISVNDFLEVKSLATALADAGQKEKAAGLTETIRHLAIGLNTKEAVARLASSKTVEAYLSSNDQLILARNEIASEEDQKKMIDVILAGFVRDVSKAQPSYSFDLRGFPLTQNDRTVLAAMQRYSSSVTFTSAELDEQCFIIPLQRPEAIRMNSSFTATLRLVFNRAQPKDRIFGIMVLIPGRQGTDSHTVVLQGLQIKNGHVEVTYADAFDKAANGFTPASDKNGSSGAYISLGYRSSAEGESAQWRPISRACFFPM